MENDILWLMALGCGLIVVWLTILEDME